MIKIDFTEERGRVKPLHGINNSPMVYNGILPELKDAGIPFVRLHDAAGAFGGTYHVDIPNIFQNFDADANDPASYDFAYTDAYFKTLVNSGMKIFYRLGVTIENHFELKPQRIYPPKDYKKWADICSGIIRHYNEGWADGFHYGIEYWEIWNEPESPAMWQGTFEEFYEFYGTAASILKERFPQVKIGGYGASGFFMVTRPDCNDMRKGYLRFFDGFLKYIQQHQNVPFDFFTWHLYSKDPHEVESHANYVRQRLNEAGFNGTESIFGEWNYVEHDTCAVDKDPWDAMRSSAGAAFVTAVFSLLQKTPVDKCLYYDALPSRIYCGLYMNPEYKPSKTYYAFKAFNELYKLGTAVYSESGQNTDGIYAMAAKGENGHKGAILIANRLAKKQNVELKIQGMDGAMQILVTDEDRALTEVNWLLKDGTLTLPAESVVLLKIGNYEISNRRPT